MTSRMPFAVPMIWKPKQNIVSDWYFYFIGKKTSTSKQWVNKDTYTEYEEIPAKLQLIIQGDKRFGSRQICRKSDQSYKDHY